MCRDEIAFVACLWCRGVGTSKATDDGMVNDGSGDDGNVGEILWSCEVPDFTADHLDLIICVSPNRDL